MEVIKRSDIIYRFGPDNKPVAKVKPGDTIIVETDDCFNSQIKSEKDIVTSLDFSKVNPATGPIEIEDARPFDVLIVEIIKIELGKTGFMVTIPDEGAFGNIIKNPVTKVIPVSDGRFFFNEKLSFPVNPMIGVIGVTPKDKKIPCGEIGDHGGNMDAKVITEGAKVYFKVRRDGAMLAMGDVHAGMGDGESVICGVEITAKIKIKLDLLKSPEIVPERPIVELDNKFITIGHGPTLDEAAIVALKDMLEFIKKKTNMNTNEASMLISAVGDLKVCQIVDPQKTARVEMPKSILGNSIKSILS